MFSGLLQIPLMSKLQLFSASSTEWKSLTCFVPNVYELTIYHFCFISALCAHKQQSWGRVVNDKNSSSPSACPKEKKCSCRPKRVRVWPSVFIIFLFFVRKTEKEISVRKSFPQNAYCCYLLLAVVVCWESKS